METSADAVERNVIPTAETSAAAVEWNATMLTAETSAVAAELKTGRTITTELSAATRDRLVVMATSPRRPAHAPVASAATTTAETRGAFPHAANPVWEAAVDFAAAVVAVADVIVNRRSKFLNPGHFEIWNGEKTDAADKIESAKVSRREFSETGCGRFYFA